MLIIAVAAPEELRQLLKRNPLLQRQSAAGMPVFSGPINGRRCLVALTGIGPKKAGAAAGRLLQDYGPQTVLSIGAAGGIDPSLRVGDIVIAQENLHYAGGAFAAPAGLCSALARKLVGAGMPARTGASLTLKAFLHTAREKKALYEKTGALVVDMESACLARLLCPAGCAFVNIRVVSDSAEGDVFDAEGFYASRKQHGRMGACRFFLANPRQLLRAVALQKNMARAGMTIAAIVEAVVDESLAD